MPQSMVALRSVRHGIAASPDLSAGGSERHRCGCTHCGCSANVQGRAASSSSATTWDGSKKSGKTACASSLAPCRTLLVAAMLESRWHINIKKNCPELGVFVRNISDLPDPADSSRPTQLYNSTPGVWHSSSSRYVPRNAASPARRLR